MLVSTGTIAPFGGGTIPSGYLACDGTAVSRTTYSELFTAVGTTFGNGDGSTTFNLPDLRNRTAVPPGAILQYIIATTDSLGAAAATSLSFSSTTGIIGTTTNNNAAAGSVGEYLVANATSPVTLTSVTVTNVSSLSLTAGDWDVRGQISFLSGTTTALTRFEAAISKTSATRPTNFYDDTQPVAVLFWDSFTAGNVTFCMPLTPGRISLASTQTIYLVAYPQFTGAALTAEGFIAARRVR